MNEFTLSQTNTSHITSNKHNQHSIQPTRSNSLTDTRREDTIFGTKVYRDRTSTRNLGVSIFRSGAINENVLIVCPLTTRSRWRGQRHRLSHPEGRNVRARQGEAIKDRQVGASGVVLPPVGML
jgi:hypothetical protein